GLLLNGMVKIPMQFFILFIGAMVFVFYQFETPPIFFNTVETQEVRSSDYGDQFHSLEEKYEIAAAEKELKARELISAMRAEDEQNINEAEIELREAHQNAQGIRDEAIQLMQENNPDMDPKDTNYIFLGFVTEYLPAGLVGLIIAAIIAASMSSTSGELNALASTTVVDIYKRIFKQEATDRQYVIASKVATIIWGTYAIILAEYASRLGSLIEAVNILGSLFYGTILGIFLVAFYFKWVKGSATFYAAFIAEAAVIYCYVFTDMAFLWFNVVGCVGVIACAIVLNLFIEKPAQR
ncbi:sodium:solute symporter, partial [Candidatus Saccharibacteria bacterium]|nr:sodium:solute symporter [Candidatus Saccharibacteria bacterium]NIW80923.1 sodium:solute symporter [Calditrichia bacterium]